MPFPLNPPRPRATVFDGRASGPNGTRLPLEGAALSESWLLTLDAARLIIGGVNDVKESLGSLSVIIPAYNARDVVTDTLLSVSKYLERAEFTSEVILVDDGSTDDTARQAEACGVRVLRSVHNRGKGAAVRRGMLEARHEWVLFMDVDNATSLDHLDRFVRVIDGADIVIGSRRLPDSRIVQPQPRIRQAMGRLFPYIVRISTVRQVRDTQCGFKLFRRDVAREVFSRQRTNGFSFDVEVLLIAMRLGHRIVELPVDWNNKGASTLHLLLDPPKMLVDLARIAWRHRASAYPAGPLE